MIHSSVTVLALAVTSSLLVNVVASTPMSAARLRAIPFVFVGKTGDCGTGYPAGSNIVTAAWLRGMGLPDNDGSNTSTNKRDPHYGLLLNKNGPTSDCSASGAEITGVRGLTVTTAGFEVGFDYRNGGHCGAGAPRFNIVVDPPTSGPDTFHFVGGCANDTTSAFAPQDPAEWTRVRFQTSSSSESFPPILVGSKIKSITILYDEGTDTANNDTQGVGLAVLDNIYINGTLIRSGSGIAPGSSGGDK